MKWMFIIVLLAFAGVNYYVILRLWQMLPAGSWFRWAVLAGGIVAAVSFFMVFLLRNMWPGGVLSVLYTVGSSWIFILVYLFLAIVIADLLPFTGLVDRTSFLRSNPYTFLGIVGVVAMIMVAGNINYHHKRRVEINVESTGASTDGKLKMVVISDLHLGYTIGKKELTRWVEKINAESPDVVLIAGDLIDNDVRPLYNKGLAEILRGIDTRFGVYMVPGNHEYISGIDASIAFIEQTGIILLRDSTVTVDGRVVIAGRDDLTNRRRMPLRELVSGVDGSLPVVVVDHQPQKLSDAEGIGAALQVSGHTHRGQIWPFNWVMDGIYEDSYGYQQKGATAVYVSSGLGIWGGKFRIGSVSEYVIIYI